MLATSQFPVQTTKVFYRFFDLHLCPPTLINVPPPMTTAIGVREGILLGGRKKFALKITIFPKNKQFALKLTFYFNRNGA